MVVKQEIEYLENRLKNLYNQFKQGKITYQKYIKEFSETQRKLEKKKYKKQRISKRKRRIKSYEKTKRRLRAIPKTKIKTKGKYALRGIPKGRKLY